MKKLAAFILALMSGSLHASTPITCAALKAEGWNYVYAGFTGTGPDTFEMAHSNDMYRWFNRTASWPTCSNGSLSPCPVNSPAITEYTDVSSGVCYVYLLNAEANDLNLNSSKIDVGVLNTDGTVTTLATFDLSTMGIGTPSTVFAGRFLRVRGYENYAIVPVTFISGYYNWSPPNGGMYLFNFNLTPTSATIAAGPTLATLSGVPNGFGVYDPYIVASPATQSVTCAVVGTNTDSSLITRISLLATGNCPGGPFTFVCSASSSTCPLYLQNSDGGASSHEGPGYLQSNVPNNYFFWNENLNTHQMYSFACSGQAVTSCPLSWNTPWTEDQTYRNGDILYVGNPPATSGSQISGHGTVKGQGKVN